MLISIIDFLKEFKDWNTTGKVYFIISLLLIGLGATYYYKYTAIFQEIVEIKTDHNEQIAKVHEDYNTLLVEQRKKYQEDVDSYVYTSTKDYNTKLRELYQESEDMKSQLIMLKQEIKRLKNEVVQ